MESRVEQAVERFKKGCNCAQAVFVTYADRFGLDEGTAMKLSSPFGGGLAGMRHVCGTVSGMSMLAGLHIGRQGGPECQLRYREDDGGSVQGRTRFHPVRSVVGTRTRPARRIQEKTLYGICAYLCRIGREIPARLTFP